MTSRIPAPPPRKPSSPDDAARRLRPSTPRRLIRAVTKPEAAEATSRTPPWLKEAETLLRRPTEGSDEHLEDETADLGRVSRFKDALASAQQREGVEHTTRHKPARRKLEPGQSSVRFSPVPPPSLTPAASPQTTSPTPSLPPEPEPQQQDRPQEQPQEPPPPPPPPSRPPPQPSFASKGVCVAVLLTASVMWCSWRPASISPPLPPPSAASAWPAAPAAPAERASPFHWLWRGRLPAPRWPPWPPPPSPAQRDRLQRDMLGGIADAAPRLEADLDVALQIAMARPRVTGPRRREARWSGWLSALRGVLRRYGWSRVRGGWDALDKWLLTRAQERARRATPSVETQCE